MKHLETLFVELNKWVLILLLTAMSVIVFSNVVLRYTTSFSIVWAEEVARYLMIWMTFLGAGLLLRQGGHVAITNLYDVLGARMQIVLRIVVALIMLAFFAVMIRYGYDYMTRMGRQMTPATRIPFKYIYMAMPIGFGLLIIHFLFVLKSFVLGRDLSAHEAGSDPATGGM